MLAAAGHQAGADDLDRVAVLVEALGHHVLPALGVDVDAGDGQAALRAVLLLLVGELQHRVDQVTDHVVDVEGEHPQARRRAAARPGRRRPASRIVSIRSLTSLRSSLSKSTTGSAGVRSTGSPKRRMGWTVTRHGSFGGRAGAVPVYGVPSAAPAGVPRSAAAGHVSMVTGRRPRPRRKRAQMACPAPLPGPRRRRAGRARATAARCGGSASQSWIRPGPGLGGEVVHRADPADHRLVHLGDELGRHQAEAVLEGGAEAAVPVDDEEVLAGVARSVSGSSASSPAGGHLADELRVPQVAQVGDVLGRVDPGRVEQQQRRARRAARPRPAGPRTRRRCAR